MSKETITLALDELKHIKQWCLRSIGIGLVNENVLAALEEALAKQEQKEDFFKQIGNQSMMQLWQNYCDVKVERDELQEKLAKQEQGEPVGWPCLIAEVDFSQDTVTLAMQCTDYKVSAGKHWLYTTPQPAPQGEARGLSQQKPLTDEQINGISKNYALNNPTTPLHFARAIEAAHGIKENT